ncbi:MAG: hypothetical protein ABI560_16280 [Myxococcales bacterium]
MGSTLDHQKSRLLRIAELRTPPLFWACEITFEELVSHVRPEEADEFGHFRDALMWMEKLCGNSGMAETLPWILRRAVFVSSLPHEDSYLATFNRLRRLVIKAGTFDEVPAEVVNHIARARTAYRDRVEGWARGLAVTLQEIQKRISRAKRRGDPIDVIDLATRTVLFVTRSRAVEEAPLSGAVRSVDEQLILQRERIAFEASQVFKAGRPYNVFKHLTDYGDSWLCAYPAAGYTLVTQDDRLKKSLLLGRCVNPRVVSLDEALNIAEAWIASGRSDRG